MKPQTDPFEQEWQNWSGRQELVGECGQDEDLARLIFRVNGATSMEFLKARPAALDGCTPRKLLRDRQGRRRLRKVLLTYPYL